ncbi:putative MFS-type transporter [Paratrimastix pyriformis]|uniref:MFS-type transporter n=1 Tax=Paratrimastix pyriformis TaxID=342808 RepID=A0ABQ8UHL0_9EUKA|nr:putative MFS-type transporter [Paratrimastix pyriformis]
MAKAPGEFQPSCKRWFILAIFSLLQCFIQVTWICFSPITIVVSEYFKVSTFAVNMLATIWMISYAGLALFAVSIFEVFGLRIAVVFSSLFSVLGCTLRWIGAFPDRFGVLFTGQFFAACAQLFTLGAPSMLSSRWFPDKERTLATTVGTQAAEFGVALGSFASGFIVLKGEDLPVWMAIQFGISVAVAILVCVFFAEAPATPPSTTALAAQSEYAARLRAIIETRNRKVQSLPLAVLVSTTASSVDETQSPPRESGVGEDQRSIPMTETRTAIFTGPVTPDDAPTNLLAMLKPPTSTDMLLSIPELPPPLSSDSLPQSPSPLSVQRPVPQEYSLPEPAVASPPLATTIEQTPLPAATDVAIATSIISSSTAEPPAPETVPTPTPTATPLPTPSLRAALCALPTARCCGILIGPTLRSLWDLIRNWPFVLLLVSVGSMIGFFWNLQTFMAQAIGPSGYSSTTAGWVGALMTIGGITGSMCSAPILDRFKCFKLAVHAFSFVFLGIYVWFVISTRLPDAVVNLAMAAFCGGLFFESILPEALEFGAELTFPVAESTSGTLIMVMSNLMGFVHTLYVNALIDPATGDMTTALIVLGCVVAGCALIALFIPPRYRRLAFEKEQKKRAADADGSVETRTV